jgi:hypothetical protein
VPEVPTTAASRTDDLWVLGSHRLLCSSALDAGSYELLLGQDRAEMVFTDPPYNVPIDGHVSGHGRIRHREFAMASGEMTEDEFMAFLRTVFGYVADHTADGSIHFVCDRAGRGQSPGSLPSTSAG